MSCNENTVSCGCNQADPNTTIDNTRNEFVGPVIGAFVFLLLVLLEYFDLPIIHSNVSFIAFFILYLYVGKGVLIKAYKLLLKGKVYNEFFLMSIATIGAFILGSYAEGVAVMLFYIFGELFQERAVNNAKQSIESLLKVQSDEVCIETNGKRVIKHPKQVALNEVMVIKAGEKVALDGEMLADSSRFNAIALTGESKPQSVKKGETVYAGMINLEKTILVRVTAAYEDTKMSNILKMVKDAVSRKAKTQLLVSRLAKIYTPIVFWMAIGVVVLPYFFLGSTYEFFDWFRRALIFLVISCPCALVISIPLGYFGGIGAASRNGILFKGSNFLDLITKIDTVVMDKTGTLTEGVFEVQYIKCEKGKEEEMLSIAAAIELNSSHPIARAIVQCGPKETSYRAENIVEIAGQGMKAEVDGREVLIGNSTLLKSHQIEYNTSIDQASETIIMMSINGEVEAYITISDRLRDDAKELVRNLKMNHIDHLVMLSGDKQSVVDGIAKQLQIDNAFGNLLPDEKMEKVKALKENGRNVAFIGDGLNDAPVITLADVGVAMGGLGSDVSIETADVVIQNDQPSKFFTAIKIGLATKKIIWQNIALALGIKGLVLLLGVLGLANLWEAVISDVGVTLLAILNTIRIQKMTWIDRSRV